MPRNPRTPVEDILHRFLQRPLAERAQILRDLQLLQRGAASITPAASESEPVAPKRPRRPRTRTVAEAVAEVSTPPVTRTRTPRRPRRRRTAPEATDMVLPPTPVEEEPYLPEVIEVGDGGIDDV